MDFALVCDSCSAANNVTQNVCNACHASLAWVRLSMPLLSPPVTPHGAELAAAPVAPVSNERADTVLVPPRTTTADDASTPGNDASQELRVACETCHAQVPISHKFCFECGTPMEPAPLSSEGTQARARNPYVQSNAASPAPAKTGPAANPPIAPSSGPSLDTLANKPANKTMFFGAMQTARAKLTVIRGDGHDGVSYSLAGQDHSFGRGSDCALLFAEDMFLSPTHANFYYDNARQGALVVRDEHSKNGVFVRIRGTVPIGMGARFLAGEQLFEIGPGHSGELEFVEDGTYFFASPSPASEFRIIQRVRGGGTGVAYSLAAPTFAIGREGNDANFPIDPFISGRHAQITKGSGGLELTDLNSKNGTFLQIRGEHVLNHGDYVFLGQQLLRIEIV